MVARSIFELYAWDSFPVYGTAITLSVVAISRHFPLSIDLSTASSMEGASEAHKSLDQFEAASKLMLIKIELFNIMVS